MTTRTLPRIHPTVVIRIVAKSIDLFLVILISTVLPYPAGPLAGFLYSLFGDGIRFRIRKIDIDFNRNAVAPLEGGQSVGKWLMGLQVRSLVPSRQKQPASWTESLYRNAPVGVATFFALIPIWGWVILALIGIPLMMMEIYLMITVQSHQRLGDVMADTEVIRLKRGR